MFSRRFPFCLAFIAIFVIFIILFYLFPLTSNKNSTLTQPEKYENFVIFYNYQLKNNIDNGNYKANWSTLEIDVSDLMEKLPNAVFYVRTKPITEPDRRCSQTITGRRIAINYASNCCKMSQPRKSVFINALLTPLTPMLLVMQPLDIKTRSF